MIKASDWNRIFGKLLPGENVLVRKDDDYERIKLNIIKVNEYTNADIVLPDSARRAELAYRQIKERLGVE